MTPEARPEVATHGDHPPTPELRLPNIVSIHPPVDVAEGEIVPVVLTARTRKGTELSVPVGSYTLVQGKPCFVPTIDVDGIVAIVMGIGLGWYTIAKFSPIFRALADRISRG